MKTRPTIGRRSNQSTAVPVLIVLVLPSQQDRQVCDCRRFEMNGEGSSIRHVAIQIIERAQLPLFLSLSEIEQLMIKDFLYYPNLILRRSLNSLSKFTQNGLAIPLLIKKLSFSMMASCRSQSAITLAFVVPLGRCAHGDSVSELEVLLSSSYSIPGYT